MHSHRQTREVWKSTAREDVYRTEKKAQKEGGGRKDQRRKFTPAGGQRRGGRGETDQPGVHGDGKRGIY